MGMIDPRKYQNKTQYYESIRKLFNSIGAFFGVKYEGMTMDEALQESVFDKYDDSEITNEDVDIVSLYILSDLIEQLSANIPPQDIETKEKLKLVENEIAALKQSIGDLAGKEVTVTENKFDNTLNLEALSKIKEKLSLFDTLQKDVKGMEIKSLTNTIKFNELVTEVESIGFLIEELTAEFKAWKNKTAVLIKGGNSGASFGTQVGIQFKDEGTALGTSSSVNEVDFVGGGVVATRVGNKVTVTITGGGVTDHGALIGLGDDDHTQYHNDTRGDVRYYTQSQSNTLLAGKSNVGHGHVVADVTDYTTATDTRIDNKITEVKKGGVEFQLYRSSCLQVNDFTKAIIASAGTISAWTVATRDGTNGTITLNVKKASYANVPTFSAIDGTEQITLSTQSKNQDNALSSWTTAVAAGDHIEISVASVTGTVTGVYGIINVTKS